MFCKITNIIIIYYGGYDMKLWGGRFTKEENQLVHNFNASISFDQKFYKQDEYGIIYK